MRSMVEGARVMKASWAVRLRPPSNPFRSLSDAFRLTLFSVNSPLPPLFERSPLPRKRGRMRGVGNPRTLKKARGVTPAADAGVRGSHTRMTISY